MWVWWRLPAASQRGDTEWSLLWGRVGHGEDKEGAVGEGGLLERRIKQGTRDFEREESQASVVAVL